MVQPTRVLLARIGHDGHDRDVTGVARTLRDAGMDVVYAGLHRTPEEVVQAAVQEDVDILSVSLLAGVRIAVVAKMMRLLKEQQAEDMIVVAGGMMPDEDIEALREMGVAEVMLRDAPPAKMVERLIHLVDARGAR